MKKFFVGNLGEPYAKKIWQLVEAETAEDAVLRFVCDFEWAAGSYRFQVYEAGADSTHVVQCETTRRIVKEV